MVSYFNEQGIFNNQKFKSAEAFQEQFGLCRTVAVDDTAFFTVDSKAFLRKRLILISAERLENFFDLKKI